MPLYRINTTDNTLKPLGSPTFEQEQLKERENLQKLIGSNIAVIDSELLIIAEEYNKFSDGYRRIDLLAIDKDAKLVVIELKRTEDGGHMELQAIRYAAMVANMTWSQAVDTFEEYILTKNQSDADAKAKAKLLEFLEWETPQEDEFAQNVRIILASANFSKEITTSVLWLNEMGLDIRCVRLSLHRVDDTLLLGADQIIPLAEAAEYQIKVQNKRKEVQVARTKKDYSRWSLRYDGLQDGDDFIKADIGYRTVRLLEEKGLIDDEVFKFLREDKSSRFPLLKTAEEMTDTEKKYTKYPYKNDPEIEYKERGYYISRNWGKDNIHRFINKIEKRFPQIKYKKVGESTQD